MALPTLSAAGETLNCQCLRHYTNLADVQPFPAPSMGLKRSGFCITNRQCPAGAMDSLANSSQATPPASRSGSLPASPRSGDAPAGFATQVAALGFKSGEGGSGAAEAGSGTLAASQGLGHSHADTGSACCHDEASTVGAAPDPPSPPQNPFSTAQHTPFPSGLAAQQHMQRRGQQFHDPRSRRDSALDHEQMRQHLPPPPNPFAVAAPPPAQEGGQEPSNPFASARVSSALMPPNPFAAAAATAAVDIPARQPAHNPFAEAGGWAWPAPPDNDLAPARATLADEGPADSSALGSSGDGCLWNTDRDIMLPHSLIIKALNTGLALLSATCSSPRDCLGAARCTSEPPPVLETHSVFCCEGSTQLTPNRARGAVNLQLPADAPTLLHAASDDASSASESESGMPRRGSGSSAGSSPPRTSLSTQDLMRGAIAPPDDSPVDLSEASARLSSLLNAQEDQLCLAKVFAHCTLCADCGHLVLETSQTRLHHLCPGGAPLTDRSAERYDDDDGANQWRRCIACGADISFCCAR